MSEGLYFQRPYAAGDRVTYPLRAAEHPLTRETAIQPSQSTPKISSSSTGSERRGGLACLPGARLSIEPVGRSRRLPPRQANGSLVGSTISRSRRGGS